jgi:hypothetical protein
MSFDEINILNSSSRFSRLAANGFVMAWAQGRGLGKAGGQANQVISRYLGILNLYYLLHSMRFSAL